MDLSVSCCGTRFENPFILASAPPTAGLDMIRRGFDAGWSGAVVKTLIPEPVSNLQNRFAVMKQGGRIIGFENLELLSERSPDEWYSIISALKREFPHKVVIGSIMGDARSPEQWLDLARGCQDAGADMLELNFSCPHGYPEKGRGAAIGQNADYSARIVKWLKEDKSLRLPVIPKLTSAVTDISEIGEAVANAGSDAISAINTVPSFFGIDLKSLRPKPDIDGNSAYGGYSGAGIKPIALRAVSILCQSTQLPVLAGGGICNGFDAAEFMLLGAPVVQVCTEVMLKGFGIITKMKEELAEFMGWHGFSGTDEFIGLCRDKATTFSALPRDHRYSPKIIRELCNACGACIVSCRDGGYQAIGWENGMPLIDSDSCSGCSLCSLRCPGGAIEMDIRRS